MERCAKGEKGRRQFQDCEIREAVVFPATNLVIEVIFKDSDV
jgi:hypothetical protein